MVCICAGLMFCGCTDKEVLQEISVSNPTKLVVTLRIDEKALGAGSRTASEYGATDAESKVNSLTLFYVTVDGGGKETLQSAQTIVDPDISQVLKFEFQANKGMTKRFYLAANMNDAQKAAFTGDKSCYDLAPADLDANYSNVVDLMDVDADTGVGSNILMTARITQSNQQNINVDAGEISIDTPVKLDRVVSKVLLTCKTSTTDGDTHAQVKGDAGWTKLEDMRYMGNMFSRKLFLFPQKDETNNPSDPNYSMSEFIVQDDHGNYVVCPEEYKDYIDNYQFYDLYQKLDMLQQPSDKIKPYYKVVKYDAARLNSSSPNLYTEGLYFPENRVNNDISFSAMGDYTLPQTIAMTSRLVSTHLMVTARFVPKTVTIDDGGALKVVTAASENEMLTNYLKECSEDLMGETKNYPQGTFWYYNNTYYTLEGMKSFLKQEASLGKNTSRGDIERFDGGWGYYYTFIDGTANNGVIDHNGQVSWGLTRNHYYMLNVTNLVPPGSSIPGNKLIKIPTEQLEWVDKGGSDITVVP